LAVGITDITPKPRPSGSRATELTEAIAPPNSVATETNSRAVSETIRLQFEELSPDVWSGVRDIGRDGIAVGGEGDDFRAVGDVDLINQADGLGSGRKRGESRD
jgi:hypothetical protein